MKSRRTFLSSIAGGAAALAAAPTAAAPTPTAAPVASAAPTPSAEATTTPSESARAMARDMHAFDANLSDAQLTEIAKGIDDVKTLAKRLSAKPFTLTNADEPLTRFLAKARA